MRLGRGVARETGSPGLGPQNPDGYPRSRDRVALTDGARRGTLSAAARASHRANAERPARTTGIAGSTGVRRIRAGAASVRRAPCSRSTSGSGAARTAGAPLSPGSVLGGALVVHARAHSLRHGADDVAVDRLRRRRRGAHPRATTDGVPAAVAVRGARERYPRPSRASRAATCAGRAANTSGACAASCVPTLTCDRTTDASLASTRTDVASGAPTPLTALPSSRATKASLAPAGAEGTAGSASATARSTTVAPRDLSPSASVTLARYRATTNAEGNSHSDRQQRPGTHGPRA